MEICLLCNFSPIESGNLFIWILLFLTLTTVKLVGPLNDEGQPLQGRHNVDAGYISYYLRLMYCSWNHFLPFMIFKELKKNQITHFHFIRIMM